MGPPRLLRSFLLAPSLLPLQLITSRNPGVVPFSWLPDSLFLFSFSQFILTVHLYCRAKNTHSLPIERVDSLPNLPPDCAPPCEQPPSGDGFYANGHTEQATIQGSVTQRDGNWIWKGPLQCKSSMSGRSTSLRSSQFNLRIYPHQTSLGQPFCAIKPYTPP